MATRPELDVGAQRLAKRRIVRQAGRVRSSQVQLHEELTLLVGDSQAAVHVDQMREPAHGAGELVGPSE